MAPRWVAEASTIRKLVLDHSVVVASQWTLQKSRDPVGRLIWQGLHNVEVLCEAGGDTIGGKLGLV